MPAPFLKNCTELAQIAKLLCVAIFGGWSYFTFSNQARGEFSFETVKVLAEDIASRSHVPPRRAKEAFLALNYDTFRLIRPLEQVSGSLWREENLATWVKFFPAGYIFEYPVDIYQVIDGEARLIQPSAGWFEFLNELTSMTGTPDIEFAGFRLLTQLPGNTEKTEYAAFLGASYFRGIGSGDWYGTSARGLAIDTGLPTAEEFPRFIRFWLEKPTSTENCAPFRMWALSDSGATSGAFEFVIHPGEQTIFDVNAQIWIRHNVQKICLVPLTSMWMWDAHTMPAGEFRPEVHDADTLLIQTDADTWVTRELDRPEVVRTETWKAESLRGFGLMQRERDREKYKDDEAHYHLRPNAWISVENETPWSEGRIELLELPAKNEGMDNIGAYFVVDKELVKLRSSLAFKYKLTFGSELPQEHDVYPIVDSAVDAQKMTISVFFDLSNAAEDIDLKVFEPHAIARHGNCDNIRLESQADGIVSVSFSYKPAQEKPDNIRVWLTHKQNDKTVSEIWSYRWITSEI